MRTSYAWLSAVVLFMLLTGNANTWEETPNLRVNYLAYPVAWNGRTITIGARFQVPLNVIPRCFPDIRVSTIIKISF